MDISQVFITFLLQKNPLIYEVIFNCKKRSEALIFLMFWLFYAKI